MASVTFKAATRVYPGGTRAAVDKLNLEVADGEFLVLVGPSGCGKSTSLRMLAGLEEVNEGQIFIGDRDRRNPQNDFFSGARKKTVSLRGGKQSSKVSFYM